MLLTVSSSMNSYLQFLTVLIIFVFVLAVTWFFTRWMANLQKGRTYGANIEVIETYKITANKYIQIIKTGDKYLAIGIGKDTITMLAEIPAEQIHLSDKTGDAMPDFKKIFEKAKIMDKDRKNEE